MKSLLVFLTLIFTLLLIGVFILTRNVISYSQKPLENSVSSSPVFEKPQLPLLGKFTAPHAILVLDVSGSMAENDPDHLQSEAVLRFYEVFLRLSREILDSGQTARIAIVLFATRSQLINWGQSQDPWLEVTPANTPRFERAVKTYLGLSGDDPRKGQDTDYLSGLQSVQQLIDTVKEPPAVIFMTDGRFEPHPGFSPFNHETTDPLESGGHGEHANAENVRWLPWDGSAQGILNRLKLRTKDGLVNVPRQRFSPEALIEYQQEVRNVVRRLTEAERFSLEGGAKALPLCWAPIFLGRNPDDLRAAGDVLALRHRPVIHCRDAQSLMGEFVAVLADWFDLNRLEIKPGSSTFNIPVQTQAFAVTLNSTANLDQVVLRQQDSQLVLSGRGKHWAGVGNGDGPWEVLQNPSLIGGGTLYLKPRFEWVLHVPQSVSVIGDAQDRFSVDLLLYSLREKKPVWAEDVFTHLPPRLMAEIELPGDRAIQLPLNRMKRVDDGNLSAYRGFLDFHGVRRGVMNLKVDLAPFQELNIPFARTVLEKQVRLRPSVNFVLTDVMNSPTGIQVDNIPAHRRAIQRLFDRGRE